MMGGGMGGIGEVFQKIRDNGSITKEEFGKINDEQFKKLDANNDGKIDQAELEQYMSKLREQFGGGRSGRGEGGQGGPGSSGGFRPREGGNPPAGGDRPKRPEAN